MNLTDRASARLVSMISGIFCGTPGVGLCVRAITSTPGVANWPQIEAQWPVQSVAERPARIHINDISLVNDMEFAQFDTRAKKSKARSRECFTSLRAINRDVSAVFVLIPMDKWPYCLFNRPICHFPPPPTTTTSKIFKVHTMNHRSECGPALLAPPMELILIYQKRFAHTTRGITDMQMTKHIVSWFDFSKVWTFTGNLWLWPWTLGSLYITRRVKYYDNVRATSLDNEFVVIITAGVCVCDQNFLGTLSRPLVKWFINLLDPPNGP